MTSAAFPASTVLHEPHPFPDMPQYSANPLLHRPMPIHTFADLLAAQARREPLHYLPFWGHTPKCKDHIDKAVLSQWYPAAFTLDGVHYPTAEHYMMAQKARLFGDDAIQAQILAATSPRAVKTLGRRIRNFDEARWQAAREDIVYDGNLGKFSQNSALKTWLLATKEHILVEASPVDTIWGIGMAADDPQLTNPQQWCGQNLLGFILMRVRTALRQPS